MALLVDRDAFDVFQLPAKSCNRLRLFARRVDIEFAVVTIRDVERAFRKVDRLRAKRIAVIDNLVELPVAIEQIQHVVFVVGNVEIAAIVEDHAFRLRDAIVSAEKLRNLTVAGDAINDVLLSVADQKRSVRRLRDTFGRNQSLILAGNLARLAGGRHFPQTACVIVGKEDVVLRIDHQIFRRQKTKACVGKLLNAFAARVSFDRHAAFVGEIKFALVPQQSVGRTESHLRRREHRRLVGRIGHDHEPFLLHPARGQKEDAARDCNR